MPDTGLINKALVSKWPRVTICAVWEGDRWGQRHLVFWNWVVCGSPGTAALGQLTPRALEGPRWDAGRRLHAQKAGLESHQPEPGFRSGAISGLRFPHDPAHSCPRPAHSAPSPLSGPAAPFFQASAGNSGRGKLQTRAARGCALCACARRLSAPSLRPLRRDLVRPGRRLAPSRAARGGLFKPYLRSCAGSPSCGAADGEAHPEGIRAPRGGACGPAGEWGMGPASGPRAVVLSGRRGETQSASLFSRGQKQKEKVGDCTFRTLGDLGNLPIPTSPTPPPVF